MEKKPMQIKAGDYLLANKVITDVSGNEIIKTDYYFVLAVDGMNIDIMQIRGTPFEDETIWSYDDIDGFNVRKYTRQHGWFDKKAVSDKPITTSVYNNGIYNEETIGYRYYYGDNDIAIPVNHQRYWSGKEWIIANR